MLFSLQMQKKSSLALSTKSLADMSFSLEKFFSPVVISIIRTPKLYISDRVEISPLYRYSGAIYPLESMDMNGTLRIFGTQKQFDLLLTKQK